MRHFPHEGVIPKTSSGHSNQAGRPADRESKILFPSPCPWRTLTSCSWPLLTTVDRAGSSQNCEPGVRGESTLSGELQTGGDERGPCRRNASETGSHSCLARTGSLAYTQERHASYCGLLGSFHPPPTSVTATTIFQKVRKVCARSQMSAFLPLH